ncbi:MAG: HI0074 family nucleotidyltransferase substrate-binding subunit [Candidatus Paracaedibacteraceae bacterium]|nr:HI0074 family nucleotidyltransferase substrate-binding subunit [Candidatus Paracaedibacteraceae bacterium]
MKLDLSSFEKAILQLDNALKTYHSEIVQTNPELLIHVRAGAIQAFEFVYELSWKLIKRYLQMSEPTSELIDQMSFPELMRTASEKGLIASDVNQWRLYREYRSTTNHTYAEDKAELIFEKLPNFLTEVQKILEKLKERNI